MRNAEMPRRGRRGVAHHDRRGSTPFWTCHYKVRHYQQFEHGSTIPAPTLGLRPASLEFNTKREVCDWRAGACTFYAAEAWRMRSYARTHLHTVTHTPLYTVGWLRTPRITFNPSAKCHPNAHNVAVGVFHGLLSTETRMFSNWITVCTCVCVSVCVPQVIAISTAIRLTL